MMFDVYIFFQPYISSLDIASGNCQPGVFASGYLRDDLEVREKKLITKVLFSQSCIIQRQSESSGSNIENTNRHNKIF